MVQRTDSSTVATRRNVERRSGIDRRTKRFGDTLWLLKTGQRRQVRRQDDRRKVVMLDRYPPQLLGVIVLVLGLSVLDAYLTLWLTGRGAIEINPVMAYYLDLGPSVFLVTKYLMTAAAATIAVMLNYAAIRIFKVRIGQLLKAFACCFAMVVVWELFMVARMAT